jgi:SNF2 family DNA or RNA helicase
LGQEAEKVNKGDSVRVELPAWLRDAKGFASRVVEGRVEAITARALLVNGHAAAYPADRCHRCNLPIINPVSRLVGYGPDCSEMLGIPRDFPESEVERYRQSIVKGTAFTEWFPRSNVTVTVLEAVEPPPSTPTTVGVEDGQVVIRVPFDLNQTVRLIPGAHWSKPLTGWVVSATAATAVKVAATFPSAQTTPAFQALLASGQQVAVAAQAKTASEDDLDVIPLTKTRPWLHQLRAYHFAKDLKASGLFMEMGCGKSFCVVSLIVNRHHRHTLIICPKSVLQVWPGQFSRHAGAMVNVVVLRGSVADKTAQAKAALRSNIPTALVINYESAWREPFASFALGYKWDFVVADESQKVKSPGGRASMFLGRLSRVAEYRMCLTGTPMPHSPLDIYAQYRFLDRGIFPPTFAQMKGRYAIQGGYGNYQIVGYRNLDELNQKMYSIAFRVTKDVLDLPEFVHTERFVYLKPPAASLYNRLAHDLVADVKAGRVTAANALTRLLRLQQVTSGHVTDDDGVTTETGTEKADELGEILEGISPSEPVVVFARFTHDLAQIRRVAKAAGRKSFELSGHANELAEWQASAEGDVLCVQIQSGGVGVDMTRSRYAIYFSTGFSLGDFEQSLARVHRPGQTRAVVYIHLKASGTVDERVYAALDAKRDIVESVLKEVRTVVTEPNGSSDEKEEAETEQEPEEG